MCPLRSTPDKIGLCNTMCMWYEQTLTDHTCAVKSLQTALKRTTTVLKNRK